MAWQALSAGSLVAATALGYFLGSQNAKRRKKKGAGFQSCTSDPLDDRIDPSFLNTPFKPPSMANGERRRVIIVMKQLPISIIKTDSGFLVEWEDARSFLSNLRSLRRCYDVKFVGALGFDVPREEEEIYETMLEQHNCIPVFLDKDLKQRFFSGFCKEVLWPTLHYVMPRSQENFGSQWDTRWQAYTAANMLYSKVVARVVDSPGDSIWVQNYHLFLVPSFLRKKLPRAKIGIFIHTPFPSSDVFRLLPARENILRGIMCADLVGFHTFDYVRHFLSCCKRVLDLDFETMPGGQMGIKYSGRFVSILISHVGIDSAKFRSMSASPEVLELANKIRRKYAPRKILVGVDDLDLVKGSLLKFQAFERFLSQHPDWIDKVTLVQVILPGSTNPAEKQKVRATMMKEIDLIRAQFGEEVIHVTERDSMSMEDLIAMYVASDAAVVSLVWDGLNLAPYEYTACQNPTNPGAVVVSEFMGCSRSLSGVLRVNPWSLEQVSDAMHTALSMSLEERRDAHERRATYVEKHTLERWATGFLRNLEKATQMCADLNFVQVGWGSNVRLVGLRSDFTHLDETLIVNAYRASQRRVLLLDYDGTLTSIKQTARASVPSEEVYACLKQLCADPRNIVFILSGRRRTILSEWFSELPELGLCAEKGCFVRWPKTRAGCCLAQRNVQNCWESLCPVQDFGWKELALKVIQAYTDHTDGTWIENKESAIVWHYENADPDYGRMQATELAKYLTKLISVGDRNNYRVDVTRYDYNRILEVKPYGVSKGITARVIIDRIATWTGQIKKANGSTCPGPRSSRPFILCVGDDKSDEEMFMSIQTREQPSTATPARPAKRRHIAKSSMDRSTVVAAVKRRSSLSVPRRLPNTFTCCVGIKPSHAHYYLHDADEVLQLLQALATASINANLTSSHPPSFSSHPSVSSSSANLAPLTTLIPPTIPLSSPTTLEPKKTR